MQTQKCSKDSGKIVRKLLGFIKNILIYVPKMNEGLMGLKRHEGEWLMTEFSFLGEITL